MKKIIIIAIIAILAIAAGFRLMTVRGKNVTQTIQTNMNAKVSVNVANVKVSNSAFTLEYTGTFYPFKELNIPAETSGRITSLNLKLGQRVGNGTVIATIDNQLKQNAVQSAKNDLDKLKKDFERTTNLFNSGNATAQEVDNIRLSYENAKIKLSEAQKQLAYSKITSAITGTVTKKNIELGAYVNPGTVIASVVDISRLKLNVYVSEASVYYLQVGKTARIKTDVYPGKEFSGKITFISPSADASHNYLVEIELPNPSASPLKAGTFASVAIDIESNKNAMYIPREALQGSIKDAKVYVVENGKAVLKTIQIGTSNNQSLEVLSGLTTSDLVVVSGQVNLVNGKPIKIINHL